MFKRFNPLIDSCMSWRARVKNVKNKENYTNGGRNSDVRKSFSTRSLAEFRNLRRTRTPSFHSVYSGGSRDGDSGDWPDSQEREDFGSCQDLYDGDVVHFRFIQTIRRMFIQVPPFALECPLFIWAINWKRSWTIVHCIRFDRFRLTLFSSFLSLFFFQDGVWIHLSFSSANFLFFYYLASCFNDCKRLLLMTWNYRFCCFEPINSASDDQLNSRRYQFDVLSSAEDSQFFRFDALRLVDFEQPI